jgi:glycosyltransferase involved in cell wall biosynthesis
MSAALRVGMVLEQALAPVPGGTARYAVQLAEALARHDDVSVTGWVAWHRDTTGARLPGVEGPRRLAAGRRALAAAWERGLGPAPRGADLVHAPTLLLPPRRRRPLVVTIHDAVPWTHPETLTPRGVRWHRAMALRAARSADAVVVPSAATGEALSTRLELTRPPVVIPLGVTALPLPEDHEGRRRRLGIGNGFVLSLATMEPRKGLDVLIRAMSRAAAPDLPLVLVGAPGWGRLDPLALAADAGLPPGRVVVLGRLPDPDLASVLHGATVLAVPSRAEGFGLPVLEGMAAGVPVVTSRDPALLEVGGDAVLAVETGDAAALADALRSVCADPGLRARLVENGTRRVRQYSWAECAARYAEIYRRVVGLTSSRRPSR